jgi:hypothetical protein
MTNMWNAGNNLIVDRKLHWGCISQQTNIKRQGLTAARDNISGLVLKENSVNKDVLGSKTHLGSTYIKGITIEMAYKLISGVVFLSVNKFR